MSGVIGGAAWAAVQVSFTNAPGILGQISAATSSRLVGLVFVGIAAAAGYTVTLLLRPPQATSIGGTIQSFEVTKLPTLTREDQQQFTELLSRPKSGPLFYYAARLEIDNAKKPNRVSSWMFSIGKRSGGFVALEPTDARWIPTTWPSLPYLSIDQIDSQYLVPANVYHVVVHFTSPLPVEELRLGTLSASFKTSSGTRVTLKAA